jgi:hypothetical protein
MLKAAIVLLVLGLVTFAVYSMTAKPDYEVGYQLEQSTLHAKVQSSDIYPKTAYTNSALRIKMVNAVKKEYLYITVKWFRNNEQIHNYADPTLDPSKFRKGDHIHAEVNLLGPDALEQPVVTTPVYVINTPPDIVEASTTLKTEPTDVIKARVNAVDADGDKLRYRYQWFRNGTEIGGQNKATLDVAHCSIGDKVYSLITAFDGEDESPPFESKSITFGSNAPQITSKPPQSLTEDRRYVYQVTTSIADLSMLNFELLRAPSGMKIDKNGLIDWALPEAQFGSRDYEVVIRVSDHTGGEAYQEFKLSLQGSEKQE